MLLIFAFSATMYFINYDEVSGFFVHLGFPVWMIYPLAILKYLGIVAILTKKSELLKEWAYAGFFFDALAATVAHGMAGDGWIQASIVVMIAVVISRVMDSKLATASS